MLQCIDQTPDNTNCYQQQNSRNTNNRFVLFADAVNQGKQEREEEYTQKN
jgi:hypothetical protein